MLNENPSTFAQLKKDLISHIQNADVAKNKTEAKSELIANLYKFAQEQFNDHKTEGEQAYKKNEVELIIAFCYMHDNTLDVFAGLSDAHNSIQRLKDNNLDPHFALLLEAYALEHGIGCERDVVLATQRYAELARKATDESAYPDKAFPNLIVKASLARLYMIAELSQDTLSDEWLEAKQLAVKLAYEQLQAAMMSANLDSKKVVSREQTVALLEKVKTNNPEAYIFLAMVDEKDKDKSLAYFRHASLSQTLAYDKRLYAAVAIEALISRYSMSLISNERTLTHLLAQMDDEDRLYNLLEKGEIVAAHYAKFQRVCKLDALAKRTIITRLCELSLTQEGYPDKIMAVFNLINKDNSEPGEVDATPLAVCRQQVQSYWHEQAAAPEAAKVLIDGWNAYCNKNTEGSVLMPVANFDERTQNLSSRALYEYILDNDDEFKAEYLAVFSDRVKRNVGPALDSLASARWLSQNSEKHKAFADLKSIKMLCENESAEGIWQRAANAGDRFSRVRLNSLIVDNLTRQPCSYQEKAEALKGLLESAFGERGLERELARNSINDLFLKNSQTRRILLTPFLLDNCDGIDFEALARNPDKLSDIYVEANFIDFIKDRPFNDSGRLDENRECFAQLFPLQDWSDTIESSYNNSVFETSYMNLVGAIFLSMLGAKPSYFIQHMLKKLKKIDKNLSEIYAEFLDAYHFECVVGKKRDFEAAFKRYDKITNEYGDCRHASARAIIQACQARLESAAKLELPLELKEAYTKVKRNRGELQYKKACALYSSNDSKESSVNEIENLLAPARAYVPEAIFLSALNEERRGNIKCAFDYFCKVAENENIDLDTRTFAAAALAKLAQENNYTIMPSRNQEEKVTYLTPLFKLCPSYRLQQILVDDPLKAIELKGKLSDKYVSRTITFSPEHKLFEQHKNTTVRHKNALSTWAPFDEMKAWSETCDEKILKGPAEERPQWQNYLNELLAHMFSRALDLKADKSMVKAWKNFRLQRQSDNLICQYSRAYFRVKAGTNVLGRIASGPKRDATAIYEQLAKKGEPMALESLVSLSNNSRGDFKDSERLARAYLLVNPDRKPLSNYIIKPSIKNIASEMELKNVENITDASPKARGIYAKYLGYKMQKWYRGIAKNSKHAEKKIYAVLLSFFTNKHFELNVVYFEQHLLPLFRFDINGVALSKAVDRFCSFIEDNIDLITAAQIEGLKAIWSKLESKVNYSNLESRVNYSNRVKRLGLDPANFKDVLPNFKSLWEGPSKKFNTTIEKVLPLKDARLPATNPEYPAELKQVENMVLPAEDQSLETDMAYPNELRQDKVVQEPLAPPADVAPAAIELPSETNPEYLGEFEEVDPSLLAAKALPNELPATPKVQQTVSPKSEQIKKLEERQQLEGVLRPSLSDPKKILDDNKLAVNIPQLRSKAGREPDSVPTLQGQHSSSALMAPLFEGKMQEIKNKPGVTPAPEAAEPAKAIKQEELVSDEQLPDLNMPSVPKKEKVVQFS